MSDIGWKREAIFEQAFGICEWPECPNRAAELAHLEGKKMGGRSDPNRFSNLAALCKFHHDMLDGRVIAGRKYETRILLQEYLRATRSATDFA